MEGKVYCPKCGTAHHIPATWEVKCENCAYEFNNPHFKQPAFWESETPKSKAGRTLEIALLVVVVAVICFKVYRALWPAQELKFNTSHYLEEIKARESGGPEIVFDYLEPPDEKGVATLYFDVENPAESNVSGFGIRALFYDKNDNFLTATDTTFANVYPGDTVRASILVKNDIKPERYRIFVTPKDTMR